MTFFALARKCGAFTANGFEDTSEPRALELDEMPRLVADYAHAAEMAKPIIHHRTKQFR